MTLTPHLNRLAAAAILAYASTAHAQLPPNALQTAVNNNAAIFTGRFDGPSNDRVSDMVTDDQGNVYVTGTFTGQDFVVEGARDPGSPGAVDNDPKDRKTLNSSGLEDVFVAKYDRFGVLKWAVSGGGTGPDYVSGITIDKSGNIVIAVSSSPFPQQPADFGGFKFTPQASFVSAPEPQTQRVGGIAIVSLDSNGEWKGLHPLTFGYEVYYRDLDGNVHAAGTPISVTDGSGIGVGSAGGLIRDSKGNLYVKGVVQFSNVTMPAQDAAVGTEWYSYVKIGDSLFPLTVSRYLPGNNWQTTNDSNRRGFVARMKTEPIDQTSVKYSVDWATAVNDPGLYGNGSGTSEVFDLALNNAETRLAVVGYSSGRTRSKTGVANFTGQQGFVSILEPAKGGVSSLWYVRSTSGLSSEVNSAKFASDGTLRVAATLPAAGTYDFGGESTSQSHTSSGARAVVAKLDTDSEWGWIVQAPGTYASKAEAILLGDGGKIYLTGNGNALAADQFTFVQQFSDSGSAATPGWQRAILQSNRALHAERLVRAMSGALLWGFGSGVRYEPYASDVTVSNRVGAPHTLVKGGALLLPLDGDGNFLPKPSIESLAIVGTEIIPPTDAATDAAGRKLIPQLEIAGAVQTDLSPYFYWSGTEGKLFATAPVVGLLRWKKFSDPVSTDVVVQTIQTDWPTNAQPCVVAADQPPVEFEPEGYRFTFQRILYSSPSAGASIVGNKTFKASGSGFATLLFTEGPGTTPTDAKSIVRVIQVRSVEEVGVVGDASTPAIIGAPLIPGTGTHSDPTGRNGFVVNAKAPIDFVLDNRAYERATRTGSIIPVNEDNPDSDDDNLVVVWYQLSLDGIVWPSSALRYPLAWPANPERIIVTSQLGNDLPGQEPLDPTKFTQTSIYHQPNRSLGGYNPNEEHALIVRSLRYNHTAAYALRNDLNVTTGAGNKRTSKPYVLLKYRDAKAGNAPAFKVYQVLVTAPGYPDFENFYVRDAADNLVPVTAGQKVKPPYPLSELDSDPRTTGDGVAYFKDYKGEVWARAAGEINVRYYYGLRGDFWVDRDQNDQPDERKAEPWLDIYNDPARGTPVTVRYRSAWPLKAAELSIGDTLEEAKNGLPAVKNWAAGRIIFDENEPNLGHADPNLESGADASNTMVRMFDPSSARIVNVEATLDGLKVKIGNASLTVALTDDGRYRFPQLPPHLAERLRFNNAGNTNIKTLEFQGFKGILNEEELSLINVLSTAERDELYRFDDDRDGELSAWDRAITALYLLSRDPNNVDRDDPARGTLVRIGLKRSGDRIIQDSIAGSKALTAGLGTGVGYVTLAENDDAALDGLPVALHVIKTTAPQLTGAIKLIKPTDSLKERVDLRHSADFAGDPDRLTFEWYLAPDPKPLNSFGQLILPPTSDWTSLALPNGGKGANQISIQGSGLQTLGDQWAFVRYKGYEVTARVGKEKSRIVVQPEVELPGRYFDLYDNAGRTLRVSFRNNSLPAGSIPFPAGGRRIFVNISFIQSPEEIASLTASIINTTQDFTATVSGATLTVTAVSPGIRPTPLAGTAAAAGLKVEVSQDGTASLPQVSRITLPARGGLDGKSFDLTDQDGPVRVFWSRDINNPAPRTPRGGKILRVAYSPTDSAENLATKLVDALNATAGSFTAVRFGNLVEIEDGSNGARADIADGNDRNVTNPAAIPTGFAMAIMNQGGDGESLIAKEAFSGFAGDPKNAPNPKFVPGWIKRVLEAIGPFATRVRDFSAVTQTYSSLVQQAGPRYEGPVALNGGADNLNSVGLLELYQTVLERGLSLSINADSPATSKAVNNALLLAASRISDLYMLVGNEAFADAEDPTVGFTTTDGVDQIAPPPDAFAFKNQLPSLMAEELALLRGRSRDASGAGIEGAPYYNRLIWNFTRGLEGEPLYVQTYAIGDQNADGILAPEDARVQFPQGHGDAWGHYLTASKIYYRLLRHPNFTWEPRAENTNVLGTSVLVDYQDEQKFAQNAAAKARAGRNIVELTYRNAYVADPAGQWQGYKDADTTRGWGVDEWSRRTGQAAYFDWVVANAIVPETYDPGALDRPKELYPNGFTFTEPTLQKIDRTTVSDIREIPAQFAAIEARVSSADRGLNPLGLDNDAIPFDIDPNFDKIGSSSQGSTHFVQIYDRAVGAMRSAAKTWTYANGLTQRLRNLQTTADDFAQQVLEEEFSYRNRLIEIFGYPYQGDIGANGIYPTGYNGPDLIKYNYVNVVNSSGEPVAPNTKVEAQFGPVNFELLKTNGDVFEQSSGYVFPDGTTREAVNRIQKVTFDLDTKSLTGWSFTATPAMGSRRAEGQLQTAIRDVIQASTDALAAQQDYNTLVTEIQRQTEFLAARFQLTTDKLNIKIKSRNQLIGMNVTLGILNALSTSITASTQGVSEMMEAVKDSVPLGATDFFAPIRSATKVSKAAAVISLNGVRTVADISANSLELAKEGVQLTNDLEIDKLDYTLEVQEALRELEQTVRSEIPARIAVFKAQQQVQSALENYSSTLAAGQRILEERLIYRRKIAGAVQNNRYQDIAFRSFRNAALSKYRAAFDLAAQYTFLAAKAYDYETNLLANTPGGGRQFLADIVKHRSLGQLDDDGPLNGVAGLSDPMARMSQNFEALAGQLGINNPSFESDRISLRFSLFRIPLPEPPPSGSESTSARNSRLESNAQNDAAWRSALRQRNVSGIVRSRVVTNLWDSTDVPEFRRFCRPFTANETVPQPALVIEFATAIQSGSNLFNRALEGSDFAYDATQYTTKIKGAGIFLKGYSDIGLATAPRFYLFPAGTDMMLSPGLNTQQVREFRVVDQRIPEPFPIGTSNLIDPSFIPRLDGLNSSFAQIRRYSALRAYDSSVSGSDVSPDTRLISRSVWNTRWMLIIPGATFAANPVKGLEDFLAGVEDIELSLNTYSYSGN